MEFINATEATPEQVLSSSDRVICKPHSANITRETCLNRYRKSKSDSTYYHCRSCEQGKIISRGGNIGEIKIGVEKMEDMKKTCANKQDVIKQGKIVCQTCHKEVAYLKSKLHQECSSCSSKRYRKESREKVDAVMWVNKSNSLSEGSLNQAIENKNNGKDSGDDGHGIDNNRRIVITLDFTSHPELLEKIKQVAQKEFRQVEGQIMYWAWELCVNGFGQRHDIKENK